MQDSTALSTGVGDYGQDGGSAYAVRRKYSDVVVATAQVAACWHLDGVLRILEVPY